MVTETMTDMPDIVILSASDRVRVAEFPGEDVTVLTVGAERRDSFLVFADRRAAIMWAALRAKELSCEGVEVEVSPWDEAWDEALLEFPDKRVEAPLRRHRLSGMGSLLKW